MSLNGNSAPYFPNPAVEYYSDEGAIGAGLTNGQISYSLQPGSSGTFTLDLRGVNRAIVWISGITAPGNTLTIKVYPYAGGKTGTLYRSSTDVASLASASVVDVGGFFTTPVLITTATKVDVVVTNTGTTFPATVWNSYGLNGIFNDQLTAPKFFLTAHNPNGLISGENRLNQNTFASPTSITGSATPVGAWGDVYNSTKGFTGLQTSANRPQWVANYTGSSMPCVAFTTSNASYMADLSGVNGFTPGTIMGSIVKGNIISGIEELFETTSSTGANTGQAMGFFYGNAVWSRDPSGDIVNGAAYIRTAGSYNALTPYIIGSRTTPTTATAPYTGELQVAATAVTQAITIPAGQTAGGNTAGANPYSFPQTPGTVVAGNYIYLGNGYAYGNPQGNYFNGGVNAMAAWSTRLSDSEYLSWMKVMKRLAGK